MISLLTVFTFCAPLAAVNGVGKIEAVFPVSGSYSALVTAKATVGSGGGVTLQELKCKS